ncbi:hypothetical protein QW180_05280 [Vibrio sinaloensis]|nr:hypothetical protein [Vibrio sinaloensis]
MDGLAKAQDRVLQRLERSGAQGECGPQLNPKKDREYWLSQPGAPKAKLANEKPQGKNDRLQRSDCSIINKLSIDSL